jgi:hypothetical protein
MLGISPSSTDYFMNTLAIMRGYVNIIALFVATAWILYIAFSGTLKTRPRRGVDGAEVVCPVAAIAHRHSGTAGKDRERPQPSVRV